MSTTVNKPNNLIKMYIEAKHNNELVTYWKIQYNINLRVQWKQNCILMDILWALNRVFIFFSVIKY